MPAGPPYELLEGLSQEQAERVLALAEPESAPAGTVVLSLGEVADRLYFVEAGRVVLTLPLRLLGEERDLFLEEKSAGEAIGWSALVPPHRFTLNARAAVDAELLRFPREKLEELFAAEPGIGHALMRNLATVVGRRLHKLQAMWLREIQRGLDARLGRTSP